MCNIIIYYVTLNRNENILFYFPEAVKLVLLSDRAGPGQGQAKSDVLALDLTRAGPKHQHLAPTLTLGPMGPGPALGQCSSYQGYDSIFEAEAA